MDTAALFLGLRLAAGASVLSCGLAAARTDVLHQRVLNRQILYGLLALALLYAGCATVVVLQQNQFATGPWYPQGFLLGCLLHAGLSAAAAVALWKLRVWPSGDAKLFALLAAGLPLIDHGLAGFPRALFWVVLVNSFLPSAIYVVVEAVVIWWNTRGRHVLLAAAAAPGWSQRARFVSAMTWSTLVESAKERWATSRHGLWYLGFFAVGIAMRHLTTAYPDSSQLRPVAAFAAYWVIGWLMGRLRPGKTAAIVVFAAAAGLVLWRPSLADGAGSALWSWSWLGMLSWGYLGAIESIDAAKRVPGQPYQSLETYWVEVDKVLPWTLLTEAEWERIKAIDDDFYDFYFTGTRYPDGLTPRQLKLVRAWCHRFGVERLETQRVIPFAPWIVAGAALTLLLRRDLIGFAAVVLK